MITKARINSSVNIEMSVDINGRWQEEAMQPAVVQTFDYYA
jgi:hypothetical protein